MDVSRAVTDTVLQLGSHDSTIYLFGSHTYLGGMGAGLWTQSQREGMSVHRALPVNHTLKGYHPNLQGPLPSHQSSWTRPGHRLISHAHTLLTGDIHQLGPLPPISPYSHTNIHTLCRNHSITYSKVWVWLCLSKFCHSALIVCDAEGHRGLFCHTVCSCKMDFHSFI